MSASQIVWESIAYGISGQHSRCDAAKRALHICVNTCCPAGRPDDTSRPIMRSPYEYYYYVLILMPSHGVREQCNCSVCCTTAYRQERSNFPLSMQSDGQHVRDSVDDGVPMAMVFCVFRVNNRWVFVCAIIARTRFDVFEKQKHSRVSCDFSQPFNRFNRYKFTYCMHIFEWILNVLFSPAAMSKCKHAHAATTARLSDAVQSVQCKLIFAHYLPHGIAPQALATQHKTSELEAPSSHRNASPHVRSSALSLVLFKSFVMAYVCCELMLARAWPPVRCFFSRVYRFVCSLVVCAFANVRRHALNVSIVRIVWVWPHAQHPIRTTDQIAHANAFDCTTFDRRNCAQHNGKVQTAISEWLSVRR